MALGKLVAVRSLDGSIRKGWTADFKPGCVSFHIRQEDDAIQRLETKGLKAVFFIKTMAGQPQHEEGKDFGSKNTAEKKIWIEFTDGEQLAGWSSALGGRNGFYFTPTDPDSNLERVFVFRDAVRRVLQGEEAIRAAQEHRSDSARREPFGGARIYDVD
jgi:hypothetical protein